MTDSHRPDQDARVPMDEGLAAELFDRLACPPIPDALRDENFLAGIYEHAAAAEARALGPILEATLTSSTAPDDACWQDVSPAPFPADHVARLLPDAPGSAPGLLWARIRADLRQQRAARHRKVFSTVFIRRAAAVILVSVGVFGTLRFGSRLPDFWSSDGTSGGVPAVSSLNPVFRLDPGLPFDDGLLGG